MSDYQLRTQLIIKIMPLLMRELRLKLDVPLLIRDVVYADVVLGQAETSGSERLRQLVLQLRDCLHATPESPTPAASADAPPASPAPQAPSAAEPDKRYVKSLR